MKESNAKARIRIRIVFDDNRGMLGPGKAELLALIRETGSIAASGRRLGMSYKRAWMLVETMNAMFEAPLVASSRGGAGHGGAQLTPMGERVLDLYCSACAKAVAAAAEDMNALQELAKPNRIDMSGGK